MLTFADVIRLALESSPELALQTAQAEAAGAAGWAEAAAPNPEIEYEHRADEATLSLAVPVPLGAPLAWTAAARGADAAEQHLAAARAGVAAAAGAAYLDAVWAEARGAVAEDARDIAAAAASAAAARGASGEWSPLDVLLVQADAAKINEISVFSSVEARQARRRLEVLLGQAPTGATALAGWPALMDPPEVAPEAVPAVLAASAEARAALARRRAALPLPTPVLIGGWARHGDDPGWMYGAAVELPLLSPGISRLRQAGAEADAAALVAQITSREAQIALAGARDDLIAAQAALQAWSLPELATLPALLVAAVRAGELDPTDYLQARDAALSAATGAIDARYRLERARLALWEASGRIPEEER